MLRWGSSSTTSLPHRSIVNASINTHWVLAATRDTLVFKVYLHKNYVSLLPFDWKKPRIWVVVSKVSLRYSVSDIWKRIDYPPWKVGLFLRHWLFSKRDRQTHFKFTMKKDVLPTYWILLKMLDPLEWFAVPGHFKTMAVLSVIAALTGAYSIEIALSYYRSININHIFLHVKFQCRLSTSVMRNRAAFHIIVKVEPKVSEKARFSNAAMGARFPFLWKLDGKVELFPSPFHLLPGLHPYWNATTRISI